jgi:serine/threonine protein kinase
MSPVADCDLKAFYDLCRGDETSRNTLRTFYGCLASALDYLHGSRVRHRDIKPQNILVKGETVYLADFGISLDWESLSGSTTTEDSAKTWLYCAPEVAGYKPRNTSSDVWSLGCVFLEMTTVLAGLEIKDMQQLFRSTNGDYRFYTNIEIIPTWSTLLGTKLPPQEDIPLKWVLGMLRMDPSERLSTASLFHSIAQAKPSKDLVSASFCGSCCEADISSEDSGSDGELWAENHETVDESLSKLMEQEVLSLLPKCPSPRSPIPDHVPTKQDELVDNPYKLSKNRIFSPESISGSITSASNSGSAFNRNSPAITSSAESVPVITSRTRPMFDYPL